MRTALCVTSPRLTDGKNFSIMCGSAIATDILDFSDMKTDDDALIREHYNRRED